MPDRQHHEHIVTVQDPNTGLRACIAIHNTARGPAFGGCRLWKYESEDDAVADALKLAESMRYKNALAELPFGGGKAVIMQPPEIVDRNEFFKAFGRAVAGLGGNYITAEDVGTTQDDMRAVHTATSFVSGFSRANQFGGDPSRFTAMGVFLSIQVAAAQILGRKSLSSLRIGVQGVGSVGSQLCELLAHAGARLWVYDVDPLKAATAAHRWGAQVVSNDMLLRADLDIFAPAAVGGVLDAQTIEVLNARIVVGPANNQLGALEVGDRLHSMGIWYLPDFLVNAGGIISVAHEYLATGVEDDVRRDVTRIAERVDRLIHEVRQTGVPPARFALTWAKARMVQ